MFVTILLIFEYQGHTLMFTDEDDKGDVDLSSSHENDECKT